MNLLLKPCKGMVLLMMVVGVFSMGTAQTKLKVDRVREAMPKGTQPGYKVIIPEVSLAMIKDAWIASVSRDFKTRVNESENELMFKLCNKPDFIPVPFEIYSTLSQQDTSVQMINYFKIDTLFFNPATYPDATNRDQINKKIEDYIVTFATAQYKTFIKTRIKKEQEKLKVLEQSYRQEDSTKMAFKSTIATQEKTIAAQEEEIKALTSQIEAQNTLVEEKRLSLPTLTDEIARKKLEEEIKGLDKDVKAKVKDLEKVNAEKSKLEGMISAPRYQIEQRDIKLSELSDQIQVQKDVIKWLQAKIK